MGIKDDVESLRKILQESQEEIAQLKEANKKLKDVNADGQKENEDLKNSLAEALELIKEKEEQKVDSGNRENVAAIDVELMDASNKLVREKDEIEMKTVSQTENAESGEDKQEGNLEKQLANNEDVSKQHGPNSRGAQIRIIKTYHILLISAQGTYKISG